MNRTLILGVPGEEPNQCQHQDDDATRVGNSRLQAESLLGNKQEGGTNHRHEQGWH